MAVISLVDIRVAFGGDPVLDGVRFELQAGDRVALLGRNGAGKSTLLAILGGELEPDAGQVRRSREVATVALMPQRVPEQIGDTVQEAVATRSGAAGHEIERLLSSLELDGAAATADLSAGMRRKVLLAAALVARPEVLLLDEPTNHLDLFAIEWLEKALAGYAGAVVFVTHDRAFLRRVATRIVHLERGRLTHWDCDYRTFLTRYDAALAVEARENALFDRRLAQEEAWLRQGIRARRTRNEGRVKALLEMRREREARRAVGGRLGGGIQDAGRSGRVVIRARGLTHSYGEQRIVQGLDLTIGRRDRLAVIGPNGCGKTTLLRLLLGELEPNGGGTVTRGTRLQVAHFDQEGRQLDGEATVQESLLGGHDTIMVNGQARHVAGYLADFLFTKRDLTRSVRTLSGGERNRLLLARLFAMPSNLLVLDEPTNDLDIETLEVLEEWLLEYAGTVLLVSHDREFVNHVATSTLVFDERGGVAQEFVGGYDEWATRRAERVAAGGGGGSAAARREKESRRRQREAERAAARQRQRRVRLSFKEVRELEQLPQRIEALEGEQAALHERMSEPEFFRGPGAAIAAANARLQELERLLAQAYERWEELEARQSAAAPETQ
jgi:ATP-binding cassette subfamily F protein uup